MEPVRELDQDDPDVLGHRQQHLADVLGLLLLVAVGAELRQLRDAVDELGDLGPEALLDVGQAVLGVLGDVVEERRLDGDRLDAEVGQDLGRGDRVGDVRLAGRPQLALVGVDGERERLPDRLRSAFGWCSAMDGQQGGLESAEVDGRPSCGPARLRGGGPGGAPAARRAGAALAVVSLVRGVVVAIAEG